jgi:multiple sugar transport system permease protein
MAGFSTISPELAEAARMDGANPWQIFRFITWPLLIPITLVVLLLSTIDSFKMFQPVYLLIGSDGGLANTVQTLGLYMFQEAFLGNPHSGVGAAISVVIFLIVFTIAISQFVLTRRNRNTGY